MLILFSGVFLNAQEIDNEQYMNAFVVVSDTSQDYFELRTKMFELSEKLGIEIDTIGRGFNVAKNLICFPEDSYDEMYAGEYAHRRYPSKSLSLEYLDYYYEESVANLKTIAVVLIITNDKEIAEKQLALVKMYSSHAFIINTDIYMGCVH